MTPCRRESFRFSSASCRRVEADFDGGYLTSDAGGLLLREVDRRLTLVDQLAGCLANRRDPRYVTHSHRHRLLTANEAAKVAADDRPHIASTPNPANTTPRITNTQCTREIPG